MIQTYVHNEWDPLEEVVVGRVENARLPIEDEGLRCVEYTNLSPDEHVPSGPYSERILGETAEDLDKLAEALTALGIVVHRPDEHLTERIFGTPDWQSDGMFSYCPRDSVLIVDDLIIEAPMVLRSRQHETFPMRRILRDCFLGGARWISAPHPQLLADTYRAPNGFEIALSEHEPLFDAANITRLGQDLLYLVSNSGNWMGARWLQSVVGPSFRVIPLDRLHNTFHIDTTIVPIREGLVFVPSERVRPDNLPEILRDWEVVYFDDIVETPCDGVVACSKWIGLNVLMLRPDLAVVDSKQRPLIQALERRGVNVLPQTLRHARTLSGGFHCVTLDLRRRAS